MSERFGIKDRSLEDLLVDYATGNLDDAGIAALEIRRPALQPELEAYELAAAAIDLAFNPGLGPAAEPLPSHLRANILSLASGLTDTRRP